MGEQLSQEPPDLSTWSPDQLIARVTSLEQQLRDQRAKNNSIALSHRTPSPARKLKSTRANREFDPTKYSTRFVALKFAYLGQRYNGLEFHPNNKTPLPTVEEELWKALNKARLVFPTPNPSLAPDEPNWEGCEYSKCGRTDRGVSAFGQVVGIKVRSNRPVKSTQKPKPIEYEAIETEDPSNSKDQENDALPIDAVAGPGEEDATPIPSTSESETEEAPSFHSIRDEIPYCQVLNRILPPDIRMLAWCPDPPPNFSARFSCKERRYKYFFTQPAFTPTPGATGLLNQANKPPSSTCRIREGWLDIDAMRAAARKFIGLHDFRNFCKLDPSKQIDNFERRIFHADIEELDSRHGPLGYIGTPPFQQHEHSPQTLAKHLDPNSNIQPPSTPTIYTFTLHGSAFLWHQVRHMAAILFLVGQGLESPSLIDHLLDVSQTPTKPQYEMADDAPLVLWDCLFPHEGVDNSSSSSSDDALHWIYVGEEANNSAGRFGFGGLVDEMWRVWRSRKMDEVLAGGLLDVLVAQGGTDGGTPGGNNNSSQKVFQGGDAPRYAGAYVPVLRKPRMESAEVVNARYAKRKGFEQGEEMRGRGFRRVGVEEESGD